MICRVCDSTNFELAMDLGGQPWCNDFLTPDRVGKERFYPLRLVHCGDCSTVQLDYTVPKETMFGDHTYLSGVTQSLSDHFRGVAEEVTRRFFADRTARSVLDLGSNDGTQLKHFQALGYDVLGVEPSMTTAKLAEDAGVPTLNAFFNEETARELDRRFDVVNAAGVFFHLEELHSFTEGVRICLAEDGVFVVQFLYMKRIVENLAFDQIYHEHLLYYNLATIERLLARHGLTMFDAYLSPIHGGSIIGYVTHQGRRPVSEGLTRMRQAEEDVQANSLETYLAFARRVVQMKAENLEFLQRARDAGKSVYGMGAPVKGNTMLNYFGVGPDLIQFLVEKNRLRKGLYSPGMHIPIVMEDELDAPPDVYYVLAWNFKQEILRRNAALLERGTEFYFPVDPERASSPAV